MNAGARRNGYSHCSLRLTLAFGMLFTSHKPCNNYDWLVIFQSTRMYQILRRLEQKAAESGKPAAIFLQEELCHV